MTVNRCQGDGCGKVFDSDLPAIFCSDNCRQRTHWRLTLQLPERSKPTKPPPPPRRKPTLSVTTGFAAIADESGKYNSYEHRMRPRPRRSK